MIDCNTASYSDVNLEEFIYRYGCFKEPWNLFFNHHSVAAQIALISNQLRTENLANIEPPLPSVFRALNMVAPKDIKVVILGQDPTPQKNKATGLAFSLKPGEDPASVPSVFSILVELRLDGADVGFDNGDLSSWVEEGVLLLNSALTVRVGAANSHKGWWKEFTRLLIDFISNTIDPSVWLLWGNEAKSFENKIAGNKRHYVIKGGHPSPQGGAFTKFLGGNYFLCANQYLDAIGRGGIGWNIIHQSPAMNPCPDTPFRKAPTSPERAPLRRTLMKKKRHLVCYYSKHKLEE